MLLISSFYNMRLDGFLNEYSRRLFEYKRATNSVFVFIITG